MHEHVMRGNPGSKKMIYNNLRQRHCCPNLAVKVQAFINKCLTCIKLKLIAKQHLRPPLQKIYDRSNGLEDPLEIDLVGPLPPINGFTHILTAVEIFPRYKFAIPFRQWDAPLVTRGLILIFTRHAYVPSTNMTDKSTAFIAKVVKQLMEQTVIRIEHATIKQVQTMGIIEKSHEKLKTIL